MFSSATLARWLPSAKKQSDDGGFLCGVDSAIWAWVATSKTRTVRSWLPTARRRPSGEPQSRLTGASGPRSVAVRRPVAVSITRSTRFAVAGDQEASVGHEGERRHRGRLPHQLARALPRRAPPPRPRASTWSRRRPSPACGRRGRRRGRSRSPARGAGGPVTSSPRATSQRWMLPSTWPDASSAPSGENASASARASWPVRRCSSVRSASRARARLQVPQPDGAVGARRGQQVLHGRSGGAPGSRAARRTSPARGRRSAPRARSSVSTGVGRVRRNAAGVGTARQRRTRCSRAAWRAARRAAAPRSAAFSSCSTSATTSVREGARPARGVPPRAPARSRARPSAAAPRPARARSPRSRACGVQGGLGLPATPRTPCSAAASSARSW